MKTTKLNRLKSLMKQPFFTAKEARQMGVSSALLGYYQRKGYLRRLSRGVYQSFNFKYSPNCYQWEDLIEAIGMIPNGVVCLISALALYGITDEIPRQHWIAVPHATSIKSKPLVKILRFRDMKLGMSQVEVDGVKLPIFDIERTIIDTFRLLDPEVGIKALKMALFYKNDKEEKLDLIKLQKYAKQLRFNIKPYLLTVTT